MIRSSQPQDALLASGATKTGSGYLLQYAYVQTVRRSAVLAVLLHRLCYVLRLADRIHWMVQSLESSVVGRCFVRNLIPSAQPAP